jgi:hypothetical protein
VPAADLQRMHARSALEKLAPAQTREGIARRAGSTTTHRRLQ